MFNDLSSFLTHLDKIGQIKHIHHPIDTNLEITEISRRFLQQNGPAIMFHNVVHNNTTYNYKVVTNLYAHSRRIALGLGLKDDEELHQLGKTLAFLKNPQIPTSLKEKIKLLSYAKRIMSMKPKIVNKAPCQNIIFDKPNLELFPIQKCWPLDVSPLITWPIVITTKSNNIHDIHNLGIYRLQPIGKDKLIVRWLKMRGGAEHFSHQAQLNQKMEVAIVIGCQPAVNLAATIPVPHNISEYSFAGLLQNKSIELVKCKTINLMVPATAEIVIEGEIDYNYYESEGPFGDHTGYYNDVEKFPVIHIKTITTQKKPVFLSTYTGKPPDEPSRIAVALNKLFTPILQQQFPDIVDFLLPEESCSYRFAIVSIKKKYPGQAQRIMMGIWSFLPQFMYTKYIIVVDDDIDIYNWKEVIWAISTRSDPGKDICIINNTPIDYLDFASSEENLGSKMGIDATNKIFPETKRKWGKKIEMCPKIIEKIDNLWNKL